MWKVSVQRKRPLEVILYTKFSAMKCSKIEFFFPSVFLLPVLTDNVSIYYWCVSCFLGTLRISFYYYLLFFSLSILSWMMLINYIFLYLFHYLYFHDDFNYKQYLLWFFYPFSFCLSEIIMGEWSWQCFKLYKSL